MKRLNAVLPDWTRVMWASDEARAVWEERISNINAAWSRIERWSVVDGARDSCLTFVRPEDLPIVTAWAAKHGVDALPLARVGIGDQYSATPRPVEPNAPWQYRVVITRVELVDRWLEAWNDTGEDGKYQGTNNRAIGELLGFPSCCVDFFERVWVEERFQDTTWPMALKMGTVDVNTRHIDIPVTSSIECNILLRWLGVRLVPHLPCHFLCQATVGFAQDLVEVARQRQFGEWIDHAYEMLSWPVEWSALHGIAEVKTPVCKISARTDVTAEKYVVRREGTGYPDEGVVGRSFPYRDKGNVKLYEHRSFKESLAVVEPPPLGIKGSVVDVTPPDDPTTWTDNGFASREAMDAAHAVLIDTLREHPFPAADAVVLDLGCGNGYLLERIGALLNTTELYGIERDPERAKRAYARHPMGFMRSGDLFDQFLWPNDPIDLAVVMPGRWLESVHRERIDAATASLRRVKTVLFYAYGDWLQRKDLETLIRDAGFTGWSAVGPTRGTNNVEAVLALPGTT